MAGIVYTKLIDALKGIGVDISQQSGSNVKRLAPQNKSTATKPGLLASERDSGGNFATVLDIFKDEAKYIDSMNDVEQMAFLNNILDYNEFGGKSIKTSEGIRLLDEAKNLTDEAGDLETSIGNLQSTAKTMKDDAEKGLASAEKDLKDFFETGGQPLKKKDDRFLGGSMHEEGQLRTAIRTFLRNEYTNGRIKLDKDDQFRVMEYSPMLEDDPIKVFKKIYGDEAYNKAGTFPGAFEIGENFKHYESIFKENMGEDLLKVKNKKYVGDGTLVLTDEIKTPTPDDDDIPFAKGGRASFVGGKIVDEIIAMIVKKEPMDAMKEVNKIIGKKGKYKNLTQKDIDRIVDQTNDHIFQRDPDNLFVEGTIEQGDEITSENFSSSQFAPKKGLKIKKEKSVDEAQFNKDVEEAGGMEKFLDDNPISDDIDVYTAADDMSLEDSLTTLEGLGATKMAERFKLKQKYPGITDDLLDKILIDDNPQRKAELLGTLDEAFRMLEKGKGEDEIIEIFKNTTRTKNAKGGRAGFNGGGVGRPKGQDLIYGKKREYLLDPDFDDLSHEEWLRIKKLLKSKEFNYNQGGRAGFNNGGTTITLMDGTKVQIPAGSYNSSGGLKDKIYSSSKGDLLREEIVRKLSFAKGGRAGYYGGGQAMVEPNLSDIGHGSDSLMGRTRLMAPGSQATTSTGLSYLLGEDNDTVRLPFNDGLLVPPAKPYVEKPYTTEMFEDESMTLLKGMYGTGKDSNKFLYNEMIKKGNILRNQGVDRETVIEIIRNNKDKINEFLEIQKTSPKSLAGLADGGIAGLRQGYAGGSLVDKGRRGFLKFLGGTAAGVVALKTGLAKLLGKDSGAISKKAIDEVIIEGGSGAPAWLEPLVNKALRDGTDISKEAVKDGQVVRSLDTPTGKVDVYYDTRTGEIDIDYMGGNTALGESVQMRYTPGVADEGTKGVKPADEFEATEAIPEGRGYSYGDDYDYSIDVGENTTDNVKNLFSDTTELSELGGQKTLTKDIVETVKKKKVLKQMQDNPADFITDVQGDYVPD